MQVRKDGIEVWPESFTDALQGTTMEGQPTKLELEYTQASPFNCKTLCPVSFNMKQVVKETIAKLERARVI